MARGAKNDELIETLKAIPLFSSCTKKELALVADIAKPQEFPAGHAIVVQGREGAGLHIITEGTVKVEVDGKLRRTLGPGRFFGEIALLDNGLRTATVTAESPVRTLSIVAWQFRGLLKDQPTLTIRMLEDVCRRLRSVDETVS
jgi:CRP/FNR family transcriptional regulator, cyclic AMP receptor protein